MEKLMENSCALDLWLKNPTQLTKSHYIYLLHFAVFYSFDSFWFIRLGQHKFVQ